MNKDKFNLDSLTTEELQGMVKAGKMAEYILSHREVDRAEQNMAKSKSHPMSNAMQFADGIINQDKR